MNNFDDLIIGDKNAIMLATRILGYGADYEIEMTDPFTLEKQAVTIDLGKVQTKDINADVVCKFFESLPRYT